MIVLIKLRQAKILWKSLLNTRTTLYTVSVNKHFLKNVLIKLIQVLQNQYIKKILLNKIIATEHSLVIQETIDIMMFLAFLIVLF